MVENPFTCLTAEVKKEHAGKVVAIVDGQIIESDITRAGLREIMRERHPEVVYASLCLAKA